MDDETRWLTSHEQNTWLRLWAVSAWLPTRLDEHLKGDYGVNFHDFFALSQISMSPEEKLSMSQLAAVSDMSPSRLSHVVARLEKRGWVERRPSESDRRTNYACLTPAGRTFIVEAAPSHVTRVRELVFDNLTPKETNELGRILEKVLAKLAPPELPLV